MWRKWVQKYDNILTSETGLNAAITEDGKKEEVYLPTEINPKYQSFTFISNVAKITENFFFSIFTKQRSHYSQ